MHKRSSVLEGSFSMASFVGLRCILILVSPWTHIPILAWRMPRTRWFAWRNWIGQRKKWRKPPVNRGRWRREASEQFDMEKTNAQLIMIASSFFCGKILTDVVEWQVVPAQNRSSLFSRFRLRFDYVCLHWFASFCPPNRIWTEFCTSQNLWQKTQNSAKYGALRHCRKENSYD